MTAHDHSTVVPGCVRCDLSRAEVRADRIETAEAEAERRWPRATGELLTPRSWLDEGMASGFVLGAKWQASRSDVPAAVLAVVADVDALAAAVRDAWNTPGPVPAYHRRAQADLLRAWPTLARAVAALARGAAS